MSNKNSSTRTTQRSTRQVSTPNKGNTTKNNETESPLKKSFQEFTEQLNESMNEVRFQCDTLNKNVDEWKNKITEDIRRVEEDLKSIQTTQTEFKTGLNQTKETCADLQQRFETLKNENAEQKEVITQLKTDLDNLKRNSLVERQSDKSSISQLREEVRRLHEYKQREIESLKLRIGKVDADKTSNNLILSGNLIPLAVQDEDTTTVALNFLKNHLRYHLQRDQVSTAYRIGRLPESGTQDRRKIILKLVDRNLKKDLFASYKSMKVQGLYINEELTPEVNHLYYQLRQLKKENPSSFYRLFTRDGIIKARKSATGKMYDIITQEQLDTFKREVGL